MKNFLAFILGAVLLPAGAACGGSVVVDGAGGSGSGASSSSGTTTTATTSSSGGSSCGVQAHVLAAPSNGTAVMLDAICANASWNPGASTAPIGYLVQGGPPPGISELHVVACESPSPGSERVEIVASGVMGPGTYDGSATNFVDAMGIGWAGKGCQVDVTKLGAVGDTVEGDFSGAFVTLGFPAMPVKGDFQVCHVPDEQVP